MERGEQADMLQRASRITGGRALDGLWSYQLMQSLDMQDEINLDAEWHFESADTRLDLDDCLITPLPDSVSCFP